MNKTNPTQDSDIGLARPESQPRPCGSPGARMGRRKFGCRCQNPDREWFPARRRVFRSSSPARLFPVPCKAIGRRCSLPGKRSPVSPREVSRQPFAVLQDSRGSGAEKRDDLGDDHAVRVFRSQFLECLGQGSLLTKETLVKMGFIPPSTVRLIKAAACRRWAP